MSKREKQKHCFHVSDVLDVIACLLGNFDVGEEKRVQEGKNKAPVTIRTMLLMLLLSLISSMLPSACCASCRRGKMCPGGKEQGTSDNGNNATDTSSFQAEAQC